MKTVGFIDYFLNEWHANEYPAMIPRRGFPSTCGKPIGFSIGAALSMPQSEGEKGEVTFSLRRLRRRSFAPPFPPSRPQAIPAAADFLFGTFSFVRW